MSTEPLPEADLKATAEFLYAVFEADRFRDDRYLRWYYRENPVGRAVEIDRFDETGQVGHFAGIPQDLHSTGGQLRTIILVDVSVHARARGRGLMSELHNACVEGGRRAGAEVVTGIANTPATPVYRDKLDYRIVGALPARVCPPVWPSVERVESRVVDRRYWESEDFERLVSSLDLSPTGGWAQRWTLELLRWRLASPSQSYAIHIGSQVVAITCAVKQHGVPVVSVLKTFRRGKGPQASVNAVIAAACRFHRAPAAIHAGLTSKCRVLGVPLPERLKPAPLNLIVKATHDSGLDVSRMRFDEIEFLDFDAF